MNAQNELNLDIIQYKQYKPDKQTWSKNRARLGMVSPSLSFSSWQTSLHQQIYQIAMLLLSFYLNTKICEISYIWTVNHLDLYGNKYSFFYILQQEVNMEAHFRHWQN